MYRIKLSFIHSSGSAQHPDDSTQQPYILADVSHLLKNLQGHLTKKTQKIYLPEMVVQENNLSVKEVSSTPIEEMSISSRARSLGQLQGSQKPRSALNTLKRGNLDLPACYSTMILLWR
ncbi:hypothetical protein HPB48_022812 [Haemaphysalis longicornis]|uniref:Uncharacterized protein n=1 Tax=Haemaphysalis longicornis TaxID=44386 RepID=A0A9J6GIY5_HAELO|nr:hypothetical protein HPB48_022812 [Haemaphysalis longicornis]